MTGFLAVSGHFLTKKLPLPGGEQFTFIFLVRPFLQGQRKEQKPQVPF